MAHGSGKKLLQWVIIAIIVFYVLSEPTGAANTIRNGVELLESAAEAAVTFVKGVAQ